MNRSVTMTYSLELVKLSVSKYWMRSTGRRALVILSSLCAAFFYFIVIGDRSWVVAVLLVIIIFLVIFTALSYLAFRAKSIRRFRRMKRPTITFSFSSEGIFTESDLGRSEISWHLVEKVWRYSAFWLVVLAGRRHLTLPTAALDDELKAFIARNVSESGGKVDR